MLHWGYFNWDETRWGRQTPRHVELHCVFWSDAQEQKARHRFILSNNAHYPFSQVSLCSESLKYVASNKYDCQQQKEVMKTVTIMWSWKAETFPPASISTCGGVCSHKSVKIHEKQISLPCLIPLNSVPLVQRTIWQPAFKRQTHKVFMCEPGVQWVQTATEEFIKGGERIVKRYQI